MDYSAFNEMFKRTGYIICLTGLIILTWNAYSIIFSSKVEGLYSLAGILLCLAGVFIIKVQRLNKGQRNKQIKKFHE